MNAFVEHHNAQTTPFVWVATAESILAKINDFVQLFPGHHTRRLSENKTFGGILAFGDAQWRMPIAPDDAVEARAAGVRTSRYNVLDGYRRRLDRFLA